MINPSRYRIIAVGKIKKPWLQEGVKTYLKRLPGLQINEIRDNNSKKETEAIISLIRKDELVVVLSEEHETYSSIKFSEKLQSFGNQRLVFIIGGADGISSKIKSISKWDLSLSTYTFPHEIAQLLLIEQLYRAQSIVSKTSYHRS